MGLLGTTVLRGLQYCNIAFPSSFQAGLQVTDRSVLLGLRLGLQGFRPAAVELIVPSLAFPCWGVPGMVAPSWVIAGLVAPR